MLSQGTSPTRGPLYRQCPADSRTICTHTAGQDLNGLTITIKPGWYWDMACHKSAFNDGVKCIQWQWTYSC